MQQKNSCLLKGAVFSKLGSGAIYTEPFSPKKMGRGPKSNFYHNLAKKVGAQAHPAS